MMLLEQYVRFFSSKFLSCRLHKHFLLYCIVLYRKFLEWPKYKHQGPLEKQDELTNS